MTSKKSITQFSTMNALLVGLYDGQFSAHDVASTGNLGLGCTHGIDGEVIIVDGQCFAAKAGQSLQRMGDADLMPFAQVADFHAEQEYAVQGLGKESLTQFLLDAARTKNLFIGVRLVGMFRSLKIRRPPVVSKPYPPLIDVVASQEEESIQDVHGTLMGFWAPKEYQGVTVAGLHIHFIDDKQATGGHVLDFHLVEGSLKYELYDRIVLQLPRSEQFLDAELTYENLDEHIRHAEG